ncbi:MAG: histidine kinase [Anaerovoracaceae bacterium]|jgi:ligand-binding sensor protein
MRTESNSLKKLISSNLSERYGGILSLSDIPLFIADEQGIVFLEVIPSPEFCSQVCTQKKGYVCKDYLDNLASGKDGIFTCSQGLMNTIITIKENDEIVGFLGGMQVYLPDTEYKKYLIDIDSLPNLSKADKEMVAKLISSIKTVEQNKIAIHEQLCQHIARNISIDLTDNKNSENSDITRLSIEKEMLEKKIIDLEAKNMSLVINPHFLFNTLNCIARIAYFEKSHTTEELIYSLSDLLRYNLKQDSQLHTIESEINNIEKYLHIQKVRFKNRLEYSIEVPENIRSSRIPNMVIQPLVENALIHGITPKRDGGRIRITGETDGKNIVLSIIDDGTGFDRAVLERINDPNHQGGIGYKSTDCRLKKYYGKEYGLNIVKSDYSGSTITITIPNQNISR